jgi:hypothetical protein
MGLENTIKTGNQFAASTPLSGFSTMSSSPNQTNSFSARVVRIVDATDYSIEFEPIKDNLGVSVVYNQSGGFVRTAYPKNNQILSIPDINSIITITTQPGYDANKKLGGASTYYWEMPINVQNTRNQNILPKNKPKPNKNTKTLMSYKNIILGIIEQNG